MSTDSYSSNNKRIAKNAVMLYVRMILTIIITLYTSRVVLDVLGVEDFGIYNIVGGIVVLFTVLNSSLSGATSRFLTFELGRKNIERLQKTFTSSFIIHLFVALIMLILAETIGLWFVCNKLVIPPERLNSAIIVYQFSILTSIVSITQVPYNAAIIAHEKMNIYAYVSIIEAALKLLIVYMLVNSNYDKLTLYSVLMFVASLVVAFIYRIYCIKSFKECRIRLKHIEKDILKPMASYSGWDTYGNLSVMARGQGVNVLLNLFFGTIINAATGITTQVQNVIDRFADNFLTAVKPQIVKYYASNQFEEMKDLICNASKFSYFLLFFISTPLILENSFVLSLWLKQVPDYAVIFCQISLLNGLSTIMFRPIMYSIHATGRVKRMSIINGTIYLSVLPLTFFLLKKGYSPITPYILNIILMALGSASNLLILKKHMYSFSIIEFFKKSIIPIVWVTFLSLLLPVFFLNILEAGWIRFILICFISIISNVITIFVFGINKNMRDSILSKFKKVING